MENIIYLKHNIYQIDLKENGIPLRTAAYIIKGEKNVIIETGPSPSNQQILKALQSLQIKPAQIDAILVTHIHLDHAGGAGLLMKQCPNATLFVHQRGRDHLINPNRLISSARAVYADLFESYFDPILPIEEQRIKSYQEMEDFELGAGRKLEILNTPGHALHHVVIYDPESNGIFSGDAAGIYFRSLYEQHSIHFAVPSTSPTQFDPKSMEDSLRQMISLNPEKIYFTHFGMVKPAIPQLQMVLGLITFFGEECVKYYQENRSLEQLTRLIKNTLYTRLEKLGVSRNSPVIASLDLDIMLNAQGVVAYVKRGEKK